MAEIAEEDDVLCDDLPSERMPTINLGMMSSPKYSSIPKSITGQYELVESISQALKNPLIKSKGRACNQVKYISNKCYLV